MFRSGSPASRAKNNFAITDGDPNTYAGLNNYFYMSNDTASLAGAQVFATSFTTGQAALDASPSVGTWTLVAAAVPEPASIGLCLAGAGFLGLVARRRRPR